MKHTEYIIPIGEDAQDYDEMFIGVIRRQPELVRCKDCARHDKDGYCFEHGKKTDGTDFCAWAKMGEE